MNLEYYKSFLWPPEDLLTGISFKEGDIWGIDIIPYRYKNGAGGEKSYIAYMLGEVEKVRRLWMENYKLFKGLNSRGLKAFEDGSKASEFTQHCLFALGELLKNTFEHGNKGRGGTLAYLGYWLNEHGIVLGVRDEGVFYSEQEVVKKINKRIHFESTKEDPSGAGLEMIYQDADFLHAVAKQNAIFVGFLLKSSTEE